MDSLSTTCRCGERSNQSNLCGPSWLPYFDKLKAPKDAQGISQEKINDWRKIICRVSEETKNIITLLNDCTNESDAGILLVNYFIADLLGYDSVERKIYLSIANKE